MILFCQLCLAVFVFVVFFICKISVQTAYQGRSCHPGVRKVGHGYIEHAKAAFEGARNLARG